MTDSSPDTRPDCESLRETSSGRPSVAQARRDAIKTVYGRLKEPELKKKGKEVRLGHKGDKHTLARRLNKLKLLYNLRGEEARPRPNKMLGMQVAKEEQEEPPLTCKFAGARATATW